MQPTTATHAGAATVATASVAVLFDAMHWSTNSDLFVNVLILANAVAIAAHPFVLAAGARLMAWLQKGTEAKPAA